MDFKQARFTFLLSKERLYICHICDKEEDRSCTGEVIYYVNHRKGVPYTMLSKEDIHGDYINRRYYTVAYVETPFDNRGLITKDGSRAVRDSEVC